MAKTNEELIEDLKKDLQLYVSMNKDEKFKIEMDYLNPVLTDKYDQAGQIHQYFWQDLWASRLVYKDMPETHYDIGSRVDGFIAHLLTFHKDVKLIDIRELKSNVDGLDFVCADATSLEQFEDNSINSLSALCSLEHFGLGRYGDPIDPDAHYKAFKSIQRVMKPGGNIYISVPVGKELLAYNAHRIYDPNTIIKEFSSCELIQLSVSYNDSIVYDITDFESFISQFRYNLKGGEIFGLFHFIKK